MRGIFKKTTTSVFVAFAISACVSGSGEERAKGPVALESGSASGAVAARDGALEVEQQASIGGIIHEPCRSDGLAARTSETAPQIEVGFAAPADSRRLLLGDLVPYLAYRCH